MISSGVEILITLDVEEMVCAYLEVSFSPFSSLFYLPFYICLRYNGHVSASHVDKEAPTKVLPPSPGQNPLTLPNPLTTLSRGGHNAQYYGEKLQGNQWPEYNKPITSTDVKPRERNPCQ